MDNKRKKILIIGASGLIGNYIYRFLKYKSDVKVLGTRFSNEQDLELVFLDILNKLSISNIINNFNPDIVIVPASLPNVEYCEEHPEESREVNIKGIKNIINIINSNVLFVYFSSDYIFDGVFGPYSEEDKPNPINEYGKQKLEIENYIKENLYNYLIIRTTVVYGWESKGKNFILGLINKLNSGEEINIPYDQINNATFAGDIALAIYKLIISGRIGIFNVAGDCLLSRFEFAIIATKILGLNSDKIKAFLTKDLGQKAKRPLSAGLKIDKLRSYGIEMSDAKTGIKKMMNI